MTDVESILASAQGGQLVPNLAQRFGLSEEQIESAIQALTPALAMGLNRAAEEPQVFEKAVGALAGASGYSFFDDPSAAESEEAVTLGRDLVSDLFGSPAETGQVLQAAARASGVRADILGQLLPILASILLSGLTKSINDKGLGGLLGQLASSGALGGLLEQILGGGAPSPAPAPTPPPRGNAGGGLLGGLLGSILGSLLGGRRAPAPVPPNGPGGVPPRGPGGGRGGDVLDSGAGPIESGGLSSGLDDASIQQAIEEIKKTLQVGRGGGAGGQSGGGAADLESILGQILGKR
ncbi:MAG: DUF937 domain-containing protein [Methylocystis sp.]|uniref:DUF937 domain-containing protein n=1 Tax=Methylocystis sp. TaxID=1911079 RepID=UPI003DA663BE